MKKNIVKNIFIFFLLIMSIYQVSIVWSINLFNLDLLGFFSVQIPSSHGKIDLKKFSIPTRIITDYGNEKFSIDYSYRNIDTVKTQCDLLISLAVGNNITITKNKLDWKSLLGSKSFIYDYKYKIDTKSIDASLNQNNFSLNQENISVDFIVITPNINENGVTKVIFVNEETNESFTTEITDISSYNILLNSISEDKINSQPYFYVSSKQKYESFNKNLFIVNWTTDEYHYNGVSMVNPYIHQGTATLSDIQEKISGFFKNPSSVWPSTVDETYTFNSDNTVIKYLPTGILEYYDYTNYEIQNFSLPYNYSVAQNFILSDKNIINEFYLSDYKINGKTTTFYFDYTVNNMLINLSQPTKQKTGLDYTIEVKVENGAVTEYRKYVYNFILAYSNDETASVNFTDAYDVPIELKESAEINDIILAYKVDESSINNNLTLNWFLNIGGSTYTNSAK